jgi:hypothetical protein
MDIKLKLFLFSILISFGSVSFAADDGTWTYDINADGISLTITGTVNSPPQNVIIPEAIAGYKVTHIGSKAFFDQSGVKTLTLPDTVTVIGEYAFNYTSLESIAWGENVTSIERFAFQNTLLKEVELPNSVTSIGTAAFSYLFLSKLTLSEQLQTIGDSAFDHSLREWDFNTLVIPDSVTSIGDYAFYTSKSFNYFVFGSGIKSIGEYSFADTPIISLSFSGDRPDFNENTFGGSRLIFFTVEYCASGAGWPGEDFIKQSYSVTPVLGAHCDSDGDGVVDSEDGAPLDANDTVDSDGDGIGDNSDWAPYDSSEWIDTDGDGVGDNSDWAPSDSTESADTDGDGVGNNTDIDDDNDGVSDQEDDFPLINTETQDSNNDGIGDNEQKRADLITSDVLSQKMIHYLGYLAAVFMEDSEDVAGQSGSWNLAVGSSVNNSYACIDGGGYNTVTTRTDFTSLKVSLTFANCNYYGLIVSDSAVFTWEDNYFEQSSPRQLFPMTFSFSNLSITDSSMEPFRYSGSLSCDVAYNSVAESWTERTEGETIIYEQQWGSLYDSFAPWNNNSLVINDAGNFDIFVVDGVNNCDFNSVSVSHKSQVNEIINAKYIAQPNGQGYHISEYTRSARLTKALTKEVFSRQKYTEETGWITEKWSRFEHNPVVKLSGNREFGLNVYSNLVPTYYWASRQNYGKIIDQEILQFSELDWVFLDIPTGKITANNYRSEPNTSFDYENDGERDKVNTPWAISRFVSISNSESQCNWILRYQDWIIVEQGIDKQIYCEFSDGFYIYDNKVWYQDANLDGKNELFTLDDDNDSVLDAPDNCQSVPNLDQLDTDNDSRGNACDDDDDNDGVLDSQDAFPLDNTESSDSDSDGVGDNTDWAPNDSSESVDTDGDGVGDNADALPTDATETLDTDGDGTGDNSDTDIDGDGLLNSDDPFPVQGQYTSDSDGDGMPDAWETRYGLDPNDPSDAMSDQDNDGVSALDEFLAGTIPSGSLDIDGNENYDALTDGLLLLRGMFGLDGSALITGTVASDAAYTESVDIESRIATLGDLADIDGNGEIDALTDGLLTLRYLFGLQGDTLINGVVAGDATRTTADEIEAHLETLMPAL